MNHFTSKMPYVSECAVESSSAALLRTKKMKVIDNPDIFLKICSLYDELLDRGTAKTHTVDSIGQDLSRAFYYDTTMLVLANTRYTLSEYYDVLMEKLEVMKADPTMFKRIRRTMNRYSFMESILKWIRYPRFEPQWHMKMRGDTRPLSNAKGKDLWGYLLRLYTDPETSRIRIPEYVVKLEKLYPGYMDCVNSAIYEGHEYLKKKYGPDVDLTPLTEKRKEADQDVIDFMTLLSSGEFQKNLQY